MKSDWDISVIDSPRTAADVLGRSELAATIARGLVRTRTDESLITAIYGPWGSGKTWLKYRVIEAIEKQTDKINVIQFSPWQIRGVDELTVQFFAQVHSHLADDDKSEPEKLAKREKMWIALARLSGAGSAALKMVGGAAALSDQGQAFAPALMAAAGVSEHFATLLQSAATDVHAKKEKSDVPKTAEQARKHLAELFSEPDAAHLLVVIDDFDRLTNDEIQTFVRLIKANANFSGLNYLLFCDHDQLAAALDPISDQKGKEFLEKIVQNPIRLPPVPGTAVLNQLTAGLEKIAKQVHYPLQQHAERLRAYFIRFLHFGLTNLRSVYRLLEALEFSAAALTRNERLEVDLVDLVAVDFLRLHFPALAEWIQQVRPSSYLFRGLRGLFDEEKKRPLKAILPQSVIDLLGVENAYTVLRTLFPEIAAEFPADESIFQRSPGSLSQAPTDYALAISDDEHFDGYFQLQPNAQKIPEADYSQAFSEKPNRLQLRQNLSKWISAGWFPSALRRVKAEMDTFSSDFKSVLFLALSDCSDLLGRNDEPALFDGELRQSMFRLYEILDGLSQKDRDALIDQTFKTVDALTIRLLLLEDLRVRSAPNEWKDREPHEELPILERSALDQLRANLAPISADAIREKSYLEHPHQAFRLWRWRNALGTEHTQEFLHESLKRGDLEVVFRIVRYISRGMLGRYDMSFEDASSYPTSTSRGFLNELLRFASREFWSNVSVAIVEKFPATETPQNGDDCLMQHLRRGLATSTTPTNAAKETGDL